MASIQAAIEKGPHQSALDPEAIKLVQEDVMYQVKAGFAKVVAWDDIKNNIPSTLKISPVSVVPQANCRPRIIIHLSFRVKMGL